MPRQKKKEVAKIKSKFIDFIVSTLDVKMDMKGGTPVATTTHSSFSDTALVLSGSALTNIVQPVGNSQAFNQDAISPMHLQAFNPRLSI